MPRNNGWRTRAKPTSASCSTAVRIDPDHFIVATGNDKAVNFKKYDIRRNKWIPLKMEEIKNITSFPRNICYDPRSKCIYFMSEEELIQIDTNDANKIVRHRVEGFTRRYPHYFTIFAADNKCHIMRRNDDTTDYVWNVTNKKLTANKCKFGDNCQLFYLSSKQDLFLAPDGHLGKYCNLTQKWSILKVKNRSLRRLRSFCVAATKNEQYLVIFYDLDIFVLDMKLMTVCTSKVKLPYVVDVSAVIMDYKTDTDLLVHGFVRNEMKKYTLNIPFALISLIGIKSLIEYAHIITKDRYHKHYEMNIDKILEFE